MAKGNTIIVSCPDSPKGVRMEVIVSGTPKPGTLMEIVPSTNPVGGRFTWRTRGTTFSLDGGKGPIAVLLEDNKQGKTVSDAYVSGTRGWVYFPAAGEELNVRLRDQPGTGTANMTNIGDRLEVDGASGMLQAVGTGGATGSHDSAPFQLLEHRGVDPTTDELAHVLYLGDQA